MISGCGVEFPREENRCLAQDLDVLPQPAVLHPQPAQLLPVVRGQAIGQTTVDRGLVHPAAQRLPTDPDPRGHDPYRRGDRAGLRHALHDHPDRTVLHIWIELLRHDKHPSGTRKDAASNP